MCEQIERLDQLGYWMDFELSVDFVLIRLPNSFVQFFLDYGMDHIISTIPELIDVLKIVEGEMVEKKGKEIARKKLASVVVKLAIGRGTARPTWNLRRRWHVMLHHLQVFISLRLILFF